MPPLPMPGEGEAAGRTGWAIGGVAGLGAAGAGAVATGDTGFAATPGLRAGALRAAGFRAAGLRAVDRLAAVFRAGVFFFAAVFLAVVLRAARAVLRAVLRTVRAVFLALLRGLVFLLVVRFFPLVLVAMACAPILLCCRTRPLKRTRTCTNHASLVQACRPTGRVNCFFHYTMIASESGNLGYHPGEDFNRAIRVTRTLHRTKPVKPRMGHRSGPGRACEPQLNEAFSAGSGRGWQTALRAQHLTWSGGNPCASKF